VGAGATGPTAGDDPAAKISAFHSKQQYAAKRLRS